MRTRLLFLTSTLLGLMLTAPIAVHAASVDSPSPVGAAPAAPLPADVAMTQDVTQLLRDWSVIKYQMHDDKAQAAKMRDLLARAADIQGRFPGRAEPLITTGLILGSIAGYEQNAGSLELVRKARDLFEQADQIDPTALDAAAAVNLGSLYYLMPGFPIGFGSDSKARKYLERGVTLSPNGLEANYFYGEFLAQQGEYERSAKVLTHALEAPVSVAQPVWDAGRRAEARELLTSVRQKLVAQS
ncbi:tetratricopeptide repeat protein [Nitrospirillum iridis]|uniref:Tetratricopeptide (TPR) repeat protein n=1 Tax=Nitrospirillum iridis TaxID=765888 RepID=A0A7X0B205_9PROT|nr:hypothetical protein [Nitrospirillum iridis]MBB6252774.1 tetratricopeptide (TPR) repeat protein [Nitrospirillum iridis]